MNMPNKMEITLTAKMTQEQERVYRAAMERIRPRINQLLDEHGEVIDPEKIHIFAAIEPQDIRMTDNAEDEQVLGKQKATVLNI